MNTFTLNIGLNIGYIETKIQLDSTLFHVEHLLPDSTKEVRDNLGGNWGKERIVIVEGKTELTKGEFETLLRDLAWRLRQNAISYNFTQPEFEAYKGLAFSDTYEGERFEYNEEFFVLPAQEKIKKEPTTILEWLNTLEEPYKTQAINNTPKERLDNTEESLELAIDFAFIWAESPEGYNYWGNFSKSL